jgi:hypothetical protein
MWSSSNGLILIWIHELELDIPFVWMISLWANGVLRFSFVIFVIPFVSTKR